jgi:hypothetical protein
MQECHKDVKGWLLFDGVSVRLAQVLQQAAVGVRSRNSTSGKASLAAPRLSLAMAIALHLIVFKKMAWQ